MRDVVLFIAMSLDGYIATPDGGIGWLGGERADGDDAVSYERFFAGVSDIVMGYRTFDQLANELSPDAWPYAGRSTFVLTHSARENSEGISYTAEPIDALIGRLKAQSGGDIWICGGANVVNQCIRLGLIDRYHINVIPIILGGGIRLFDTLDAPQRLHLISTEHYNGIVDLVYVVR